MKNLTKWKEEVLHKVIKKEEDTRAAMVRKLTVSSSAATVLCGRWIIHTHNYHTYNYHICILFIQEKREKLIEEVRLMFGRRIDPQDEKFQEALEKKEQEDRKAEKALKKQQKQQKMLEQLRKLADSARAQGTELYHELGDTRAVADTESDIMPMPMTCRKTIPIQSLILRVAA